MGRLEDPNFKYITKAESDKPGYLERRMKLYREMVKKESEGAGGSREVYPGKKETSNGKANSGLLLDLSSIRERAVQDIGKRKHRG